MMKTLLVITIFVAFLALGAESFRVPRQAAAEEEEEKGPLTAIADKVKSLYNDAVNTASEYVESIKGLKIEEKAMNLITDTTKVVTTYTGIMQDQLYYFFYSQ